MHVKLWASMPGGRPCYQTAVSDQQYNSKSGGSWAHRLLERMSLMGGVDCCFLDVVGALAAGSPSVCLLGLVMGVCARVCPRA